MHPPEFPPGTRVWWSEIGPGGYISLQPMPDLGIGGGNSAWILAKRSDGTPIPVPEPGAKVDGTAVWNLGVNTPNGAWSGEQGVLFVGDRAGALEQAKILFSRHHNGAGGWIYNGWLPEVAPELKSSGPNAFSVTRTNMNQSGWR
jgi:hypothetical protein